MKLPECPAGTSIMANPANPVAGSEEPGDKEDGSSDAQDQPGRVYRPRGVRRVSYDGLQQSQRSPRAHRCRQTAQKSMPSLRKWVMLFWSTGISAVN